MRPRLPATRRGRAALIAALVLAAALLVWWRGPAWSVVETTFDPVRWWWVLAAVVLNLVSILVRVLAWRTVIRQAVAPPWPPFRAILSAFSVGLLANAVLPGRIGEVARVAVLAQKLPGRRGVWATLVGTVFAHRVFDLVAVMLLIAYVLSEAVMPTWAVRTLVAMVAVGVVLLAVGILAARRGGRALDELGRVALLLAMARQGLGVMRTPLAAARAVGLQCVGWTLQLLAVFAVMRAFNIVEPLHAAALVLVLMNAAMVITLWPGNVGLVQAAVALPLVAYGINYAHGFAFGIGLQAIEVGVGVGLGLVFLAREGLSFAMLREIPDAAHPDEATAAQERGDVARARVPG